MDGDIILIILASVCFAFFGLSESLMDKLQFHFERSIFSNLKNHRWWNPKISWVNKWKNGDKEQGERFWKSSSLFVFTTDAWHFFKFSRNLFLMIGVFFLLLIHFNFVISLLITFGLRVIFGLTFTLSFKNLLEKKK